jgi:CheY-like chemotaxis protein
LEAVDLAQSLRPDMVLMDIQLPGEIDGIEAAGQLRNLDVPVVYVTGYCEGPLLQRAKMTEPYGYILKPYHTHELETTIELGLYKHRADQERGRMLKDLQEKLANCKTLAGLLPICCYCKKIKDDAGRWSEIEAYIMLRTGASFTHGMCPGCFEKVKKQLDALQQSGGDVGSMLMA